MKKPTSIFERCARWLLQSGQDQKGWTICHGIILGEWRDDVWSHCWLEKRSANLVLDLSRPDQPVCMDANLHPDIYATDEYTAQQLRALINKHRHFGPFDQSLQAIGERTIH